ncbi:MAG: YbjN domain-containing protein [Alphaproteobacteria bacterium]|nr:YbjN domain-containing protein [Alphaproteobacteria bacterium]
MAWHWGKAMRGAAMAGALVTALSGAAAAEDTSSVYKDISAAELQRLLTIAGVESVAGSDKNGNPIIYAQAGDTQFVVRTFECARGTSGSGENALRCQRMQYQARFELPTPPSRADMNAFNQTWVFGKAYVTDNGLAAIEYPVNLTMGVTEANLVHNFVLWVSILEEFIAHLSHSQTS